MMMSSLINIEPIITAVIGSGAKKILDVGCGWGKYGLLIKEAIASIRSEAGELSPKLSDIEICSVESGKYFLDNSSIKSIYKYVYETDMFDVPSVVYNNQDIVLFIDVLEHHDRNKVLELLRRIKTKVLVSVPKYTTMFTQRYYDTDPHITQWTPNDFKEFNIEDISTYDSWILILN